MTLNLHKLSACRALQNAELCAIFGGFDKLCSAAEKTLFDTFSAKVFCLTSELLYYAMLPAFDRTWVSGIKRQS